MTASCVRSRQSTGSNFGGKNAKNKGPGSAQTETDEPETKAWGEQEDAQQERRTEPAQFYPQCAPACRKQTQNIHERNHPELPMRLGMESKEIEWSRTQSLAMHRATLARTPEGKRESSESSEPVTCGERCRSCWTLKEKRTSKRLTQSVGV